MQRRALCLQLLFASAVLNWTSNGASTPSTVASEILKHELQQIADTPANEPVILRLDQEAENLTATAATLPASERVDYVANGMSVNFNTYKLFGMPDLTSFAKLLLGLASFPNVVLSRQEAKTKPLTQDLKNAWAANAKLYGSPLPSVVVPPPIYKVALGYQKATNAQTQGYDQATGRCIVVLNWSALAPRRYWDSAILHETWHCFQGVPTVTDPSILQRCFKEGVVMLLAQEASNPKLDALDIMFWTQAEWDAGVKHLTQLAKVFNGDRTLSGSSETANQYLYLNVPVKSVSGSPSRSGYFLMLLAMRAWKNANPTAGAKEVLEADPEAVWQTFWKMDDSARMDVVHQLLPSGDNTTASLPGSSGDPNAGARRGPYYIVSIIAVALCLIMLLTA